MSEKSLRHLHNAQAMKARFDFLAPYTTEEIAEIWERYSSEYWAAGWLGGGMDEDEERVRQVFITLYRRKDS